MPLFLCSVLSHAALNLSYAWTRAGTASPIEDATIYGSALQMTRDNGMKMAAACDNQPWMLNFANNLSKARSRTSGVADSKPDEGFKVVDRRLFTEEGELRKDAADQDRRWEEESAEKKRPLPHRKRRPKRPRRALLRPCHG